MILNFSSNLIAHSPYELKEYILCIQFSYSDSLKLYKILRTRKNWRR